MPDMVVPASPVAASFALPESVATAASSFVLLVLASCSWLVIDASCSPFDGVDASFAVESSSSPHAAAVVDSCSPSVAPRIL
jgi:hypothetical protein